MYVDILCYDLQHKCNPYENNRNVSHTNIKSYPKLHMELEKDSNNQISLKPKTQSWQ